MLVAMLATLGVVSTVPGILLLHKGIFESGSIGLYSQRNNLSFVVSECFVSVVSEDRELKAVGGVFRALYMRTSFPVRWFPSSRRHVAGLSLKLRGLRELHARMWLGLTQG